MLSVSHPVLFHLYRRIDRNRPVRQVVEPGSELQGRTSSIRADESLQRTNEGDGSDFHAYFLKAMEKLE